MEVETAIVAAMILVKKRDRLMGIITTMPTRGAMAVVMGKC